MPVNGAQRAAEAVGTGSCTAQHFYRKVALGTPHRIDHLRHTRSKSSALRKAITYKQKWGARAWGVDRQPRVDRHRYVCTRPAHKLTTIPSGMRGERNIPREKTRKERPDTTTAGARYFALKATCNRLPPCHLTPSYTGAPGK